MIWIELSSIEAWGPQPSGISRVCSKVIENILLQKDKFYLGEPALGFFKFSVRQGQFYVVSDPEKIVQKARSVQLGLSDLEENLALPLSDALQEGDTLFQMGASWVHPRMLNFIKLYKPQFKLRYVHLVYDLIPYLFPHFFDDFLQHHFVAWVDNLLPYADEVLTISAATKKDVLRVVPHLSEEKISVVRIGDELNAPNRNGNLPILPREYVLCCGTIEIRKNHELLYKAWKILSRSWGASLPALVLVGHPGWLTQDLIACMKKDPETKDKIIIFNSVHDQQLGAFYQNSLMTIYPSHYEGWGLPIAESLAYGKFCLCSSSSSMTEIAPELVETFDPENVQQLVEKLNFYLSHREQLKAREEAVKKNYQTTQWSETANAILNSLAATDEQD